jgi:hypothetical protein
LMPELTPNQIKLVVQNKKKNWWWWWWWCS